MTASGPPISNVRPAAAGVSTACAKNAPTSSTQIGCRRVFPSPTTGVSGLSFTWRTNIGSTPPSLPKTKLGRKITCSSPAPLTACSIAHFARKYGVSSAVRVDSERAHEHEPARAGVLRGGHQALRAADHDPVVVLLRALDDRDQVDDRLAPLGRASQAVRIRHVPLHEVAAPGLQRLLALGPADEHPHVVAARPQGVHDLRPDEARAAGDEDLNWWGQPA